MAFPTDSEGRDEAKQRGVFAVADAFDKIGLTQLHGDASGIFAAAVHVPPDWTLPKVFQSLARISDVRSIDTVLVNLFGLAVVSFFRAQEPSDLRVMQTLIGEVPIPISMDDYGALCKVTAAVALGSPSAAQPAGCTSVRMHNGGLTAEFPDVRGALRYRASSRCQSSSWDRAARRLRRVSGERSWHARATGPPGLSLPDDSVFGREASSSRSCERDLVIDLCKVADGRDKRASCIVRNIPHKATRGDVIGMIDRVVSERYDCFILPVVPVRACNAGFAFINFKDPEAIIPFYEEFHERPCRLSKRSNRVLEVRYSRDQGNDMLASQWGYLDPGSDEPSREDAETVRGPAL